MTNPSIKRQTKAAHTLFKPPVNTGSVMRDGTCVAAGSYWLILAFGEAAQVFEAVGPRPTGIDSEFLLLPFLRRLCI
jgi:hypothetical protein